MPFRRPWGFREREEVEVGGGRKLTEKVAGNRRKTGSKSSETRFGAKEDRAFGYRYSMKGFCQCL